MGAIRRDPNVKPALAVMHVRQSVMLLAQYFGDEQVYQWIKDIQLLKEGPYSDATLTKEDAIKNQIEGAILQVTREDTQKSLRDAYKQAIHDISKASVEVEYLRPASAMDDPLAPCSLGPGSTAKDVDAFYECLMDKTEQAARDFLDGKSVKVSDVGDGDYFEILVVEGLRGRGVENPSVEVQEIGGQGYFVPEGVKSPSQSSSMGTLGAGGRISEAPSGEGEGNPAAGQDVEPSVAQSDANFQYYDWILGGELTNFVNMLKQEGDAVLEGLPPDIEAQKNLIYDKMTGYTSDDLTMVGALIDTAVQESGIELDVPKQPDSGAPSSPPSIHQASSLKL